MERIKKKKNGERVKESKWESERMSESEREKERERQKQKGVGN